MCSPTDPSRPASDRGSAVSGRLRLPAGMACTAASMPTVGTRHRAGPARRGVEAGEAPLAVRVLDAVRHVGRTYGRVDVQMTTYLYPAPGPRGRLTQDVRSVIGRLAGSHDESVGRWQPSSLLDPLGAGASVVRTSGKLFEARRSATGADVPRRPLRARGLAPRKDASVIEMAPVAELTASAAAPSEQDPSAPGGRGGCRSFATRSAAGATAGSQTPPLLSVARHAGQGRRDRAAPRRARPERADTNLGPR